MWQYMQTTISAQLDNQTETQDRICIKNINL